MYAHECSGTPTHMQMFNILLYCFLPYCPKTGFLTESEAHRFTEAGWPVSSHDPPVSVLQFWAFQAFTAILGFLHGYWI